jgi:hypothetical protein
VLEQARKVCKKSINIQFVKLYIRVLQQLGKITAIKWMLNNMISFVESAQSSSSSDPASSSESTDLTNSGASAASSSAPSEGPLIPFTFNLDFLDRNDNYTFPFTSLKRYNSQDTSSSSSSSSSASGSSSLTSNRLYSLHSLKLLEELHDLYISIEISTGISNPSFLSKLQHHDKLIQSKLQEAERMIKQSSSTSSSSTSSSGGNEMENLLMKKVLYDSENIIGLSILQFFELYDNLLSSLGNYSFSLSELKTRCMKYSTFYGNIVFGNNNGTRGAMMTDDDYMEAMRTSSTNGRIGSDHHLHHHHHSGNRQSMKGNDLPALSMINTLPSLLKDFIIKLPYHLGTQPDIDSFVRQIKTVVLPPRPLQEETVPIGLNGMTAAAGMGGGENRQQGFDQVGDGDGGSDNENNNDSMKEDIFRKRQRII